MPIATGAADHVDNHHDLDSSSNRWESKSKASARDDDVGRYGADGVVVDDDGDDDGPFLMSLFLYFLLHYSSSKIE